MKFLNRQMIRRMTRPSVFFAQKCEKNQRMDPLSHLGEGEGVLPIDKIQRPNCQ